MNAAYLRIQHEEPHRLIATAPAKLNLYLEVGARRNDGFHELDSLFQSISLCDSLEFSPRQDGRIVLQEEGIACGETNLVARAARLMQEASAGQRRGPLGATIRLTKRIPQGAGLGGGSSDAATTLVALARLWGAQLPFADLERLAAALGSDVPFFLVGGTARCRGRGEVVEPLHDEFDGRPSFHYVVVFPRVEVPTSLVYARLAASRAGEHGPRSESLLSRLPKAGLYDAVCRGELFFNRLEGVARHAFPELERLRRQLDCEGFAGVQMTGSGSAFFGLCTSGADAAERAQRLSQSLVGVDVFAVESLPRFGD